MEQRTVGRFVLQGGRRQLDEMSELLNSECYKSKKFKKYFYVWVHYDTGVYFFPKEKYFVSRDGETNYAVALLQYGASLEGEIYGK